MRGRRIGATSMGSASAGRQAARPRPAAEGQGPWSPAGPAGRDLSGVILLLWLALLAGVLAGLHAIGGPLTPPPLTDAPGVGQWLGEREPAEAAFALLRLIGLAAAWYLLSATIISSLARLSRMPALVRTTDVFTVPAVRRLANAVVGVSVATATLTTGAGAAVASSALGPSPRPHLELPTLLVGPPAAGADATPTAGGEQPKAVQAADPRDTSDAGAADRHGRDEAVDELPTLRRLPDEPGLLPPPPAPLASPDKWEIRPGQHFWAVAERVLATTWQRAPSDAEVDRYWRRLVEANRAVLRVPDNPDLLYPDQVITLPPPPPAPAIGR
ncbi:MAG TPA: hypothetical protein VMZ73_00605 [Acidimicrobiales bacterium]|nr:hypothetical protein [Acidimicrobiales bacterium]